MAWRWSDMSEVLNFTPPPARKFIVARGAHSSLPYLSKEGETYRWVNNIHKALRFSTEEEAEGFAKLVAGGASVAELIEA